MKLEGGNFATVRRPLVAPASPPANPEWNEPAGADAGAPKNRISFGLMPLLLLASGAAFGQGLVEVKGFKVSDSYPPPLETQVKMLLEGARAQPQTGGLTILTDAKLQTFSEKGEPELVLEAPQCLYDSGQHTLHSPGPLHMHTADGKFVLEGEGFLWQQSQSSLFISNRVHTLVQPGLLDAGATNPPVANQPQDPPTIDIFSHQFEYHEASSLGTYRGEVLAAGTNFSLSSGELTVDLPMKERRLQSLTADDHAVLDYTNFSHVHATGEHAVYTASTGLIRINGQPTWRAEEREGRADELLIDATNKVFRANGKGWLKMPAQGANSYGFLSAAGSTGNTTPPATNQTIEILSENYELRTNAAVFLGNVRVSQRAGEDLKGTMNCGRMGLSFSGTNELERMVAEDGVVIAQGEQSLSAQKAVYTGSNGLMDLTQFPSWRSGSRGGKGDRMRVDLRQHEMLVSGNASMRFPAAELNQSAVLGAGPARAPRPTAGTNEFTDIFSEEYTLRETNAVFHGGVYITHPNANWACETMTVALPKEGGQIGSLVAEQGVAFDLVSREGQKVHGKGDKAVYTSIVMAGLTNELMRLTGTPALLVTTNGTIRNRLLLLDLTHNKLEAPGDFTIRGLGPAPDTNAFRLPTRMGRKSAATRSPTPAP